MTETAVSVFLGLAMTTDRLDDTAALPQNLMRILNTLVIVDNLPMLGIFRTVLSELGMQNVRHGRSAQEVVSILIGEPIDLIVIDDYAPLDGVAFLRTLRRGTTKLPNAVPVIFVTGVAERERVIAARDAGANEILIKPFTAVQLRGRLETSLKKPRSFVEAQAYVGPDRRRRRDDATAMDRRESDRGPDRRERPGSPDDRRR